jgi:two-component system response regulator HydG
MMVVDGERRSAGTHAVRSDSAAAAQESAAGPAGPDGPDGQDLPTILVVDDEPELCYALSKLLRRNNYKVLTANNGEEALAVLRQQEVHLVLSDLLMPKVGGLELLKAAQVVSPATEVVIITGHGTIEAAVDAMKMGAYDFIEKPFTSATTLNTVRKALEKQQLIVENLELRRRLEEIQGTSDIIGNSEAMRVVVETARQVADSSATVLLTGESGTGKEVFAHAIHRWSDRAKRQLVTVSCAALPETLLEAELFGYERGAFTGAVGRHKGRFELAHRGTLFLDEVGEMSFATQVKLLRVLQEGVFERLGGTETIDTDVRIVAATNADLAAKVERLEFRADLFYRLNVVNIELPPLRARGEDVILLANFFLQVYNQKNDKVINGFTKSAVEVLTRYSWPGNVRELENCIERAVVLSKGPFVDIDVLPPAVIAGKQRFDALTITVGTTLAQAEMELIRATLESTGGDKETAANILGIASRTIYRKLK